MNRTLFCLALLGCSGGQLTTDKGGVPDETAEPSDDGGTTDSGAGDGVDGAADGADGAADGAGDSAADGGDGSADGSTDSAADGGDGADGATDSGADGGDGSDGGGGGVCGPLTSAPEFRAISVDSLDGPAYAEVADMNADGQLDVVVSAFGLLTGFEVPIGQVVIYEWSGDLDSWSLTETVIPEADGIKFPNQPTAHDVDGDADLDLIVPTGFFICDFVEFAPCGALYWLENAGGGVWSSHELVAAGSNGLFYHHVEVTDLDQDGVDDLLTGGEAMETFTTDAAAMIQYLPGSGGGAFGAPVDLVEGGGSFPRPVDVDGDGDLDVISAEYFLEASSYAWFEQGSGFSWTRHIIDAESGPAIQIHSVADLYGDGVWRAVGSNHTNTATFPPDDYESAVVALTPGADPTEPWEKVQLSTGIVSAAGSFLAPMAAPGIFDVGDLDYDGDEDIAVSGDGDPQVYWMEQTTPGTFEMHVLNEDLPQAGAMKIADLDGDGCNEIVVTGYEDGDIFVYQRADL